MGSCFNYLECPMCGGDLIYSDGTHDMECRNKTTTGCVFAVSFSVSAHRGTLWSIRTVDDRTNYKKLNKMLREIEVRRQNDQYLADNIPNQPKKIVRSRVTKLAFRYSLEKEDIYSIKYSSESPDRLALFYGISETDVRMIREAEV